MSQFLFAKFRSAGIRFMCRMEYSVRRCTVMHGMVIVVGRQIAVTTRTRNARIHTNNTKYYIRHFNTAQVRVITWPYQFYDITNMSNKPNHCSPPESIKILFDRNWRLRGTDTQHQPVGIEKKQRHRKKWTKTHFYPHSEINVLTQQK